MFLEISFVHWLVILSSLISLSGGISYVRGINRGDAKPNLVTWFMWALAPLIGVGAAISAHADLWGVVRIFLAGFIPLMVIFAVFNNPRSYWKLTTFDFLCGACSLIALIIWLVIDKPVIAVLFAAIGDAFAGLPTITKAWKHPETENGLTYVASLVSVCLVLPSIQIWNIENSSFQIYLLIVNIILIYSVYRKRIFRKTI